MNHRMIITALVMGFGALMVSSFSFSQPEGRPMPPNEGPVSPEQRVKELKKELNLTDKQEGNIQRIFEAQNKEMKELFESEMKARDAKREEMKAERDALCKKIEKQRKDTDAKISAILTDEQKKKFKELQKNHDQRPPRKRRHGGENNMPMPEECPDRCE